jgi:hypothetical protein
MCTSGRAVDKMGLFRIVVAVAVQSAFRFEMHQNKFF